MQKAASAADADAPSLMPNHDRCMTVESVSTTTPVLYHNHLHYRSAPPPQAWPHLALLTTQYRLHTVPCIIIQPLHRPLQGQQSRVLLLLLLLLFSSRLLPADRSLSSLHTPRSQQSAAYFAHIYPGPVACDCGVGIPRERSLHECIAAAAKTTSIFIRLPEPRPR